MDKQFDFSQVGKKMPYTVPDGYFDQMEREVTARVKARLANRSKRKTLVLRWALYAASVAACLVIAIATFTPQPYSPEKAIEQEYSAFDKLSAEDQDYLLEVYDNDVFLNEFIQ